MDLNCCFLRLNSAEDISAGPEEQFCCSNESDPLCAQKQEWRGQIGQADKSAARLDETKTSAEASLSSSEETELSEDKDSLKDSKGTQESDPVHPVGCEQDQAEGQQDVSAEETKTAADSESSCMEIEEPLLNQEDTTEVEIPLIHDAKEKEEGGKEEEGGMQGKAETSEEPMKVDLTCEEANVSNKDVEMNSQVESMNDPTETEQEG